MLLFVAMPYAALVLFFSARSCGTAADRSRSRASPRSSSRTSATSGRRCRSTTGSSSCSRGTSSAFLVPGAILGWNAAPLRLYVLEASALAFALLDAGRNREHRAAARVADSKARVTTTPTDWVRLRAAPGAGRHRRARRAHDDVGLVLVRARSCRPTCGRSLTFAPDLALRRAAPLLVKAAHRRALGAARALPVHAARARARRARTPTSGGGRRSCAGTASGAGRTGADAWPTLRPPP